MPYDFGVTDSILKVGKTFTSYVLKSSQITADFSENLQEYYTWTFILFRFFNWKKNKRKLDEKYYFLSFKVALCRDIDSPEIVYCFAASNHTKRTLYSSTLLWGWFWTRLVLCKVRNASSIIMLMYSTSLRVWGLIFSLFCLRGRIKTYRIKKWEKHLLT